MNAVTDFISRNKNTILAQLPVLACLAYGLYFMPNTTYWWDSGDFISTIAAYGIPHPSGYPFYINLGRIFWLLASSNIWGINLLSLLSSLIALQLTSVIVSLLIYKKPWSWTVTAIPIMFFVPAFFENSLVPVVYPLNLLGISILTYLSLRILEKREPKLLLLLAFLSGLFAGNHMFAVIYVFIFILLYFIRFKGEDRLLLWGFIFFALGMSIYLYLPIKSIIEPFYNWVKPHNFMRFYFVVGMKGYSDQTWIKNWDTLRFFLTHWHSYVLVPELGWIFLTTGLLGLFGALRNKAWRPLVYLLLIIGGWNLFSMIYHACPQSLHQWHRYWFLFFWVIWVGLLFFIAKLLEITDKTRLIAIPLILLIGVYSGYRNLNFADGVKNNGADYFTKLYFSFVPYNLMFHSTGDNASFNLSALQRGKGIRPDLSIIWRLGARSLLPKHEKLFDNLINYKMPEETFASTDLIFSNASSNTELIGSIFLYSSKIDYFIETKKFNNEVLNKINSKFKNSSILKIAVIESYLEPFKYLETTDPDFYKDGSRWHVLYCFINKVKPDNTFSKQKQIVYKWRNEDFKGSYEQSCMLQESEPWHGLPYFTIFSYCYATNEKEKAADIIDLGLKMTKMGDRKNFIHRTAGKIALDARNYDDAIYHFEKAKMTKEPNYGLIIDLILAHTGKNDWISVDYYLKLAEGMDSTSSSFYMAKGIIEMQKEKNNNKAIEFFIKSLEKDENEIRALSNIILCYKRLGMQKEAKLYEDKLNDIRAKSKMLSEK
ncbi:MAG: DUF2723 domain-containing protein [Candidatus Coatesbacteria bacterium]|nr:DUF2723 domain-containing protein [Candidatus Coatesbacteria bacterium]